MPATYGQGPQTRRSSGDGQSMVEFAIGLLVMMLLIFGILDLSRAVFARNAMASAAREGARYAITNPDATPSDIADVATAMIAGLDVNEVHVAVAYPTTLGVQTVQVEVTYTFHAVTPLIGQIVDGASGEGIVLRGRSQMIIERRD